MPHAACLDVYTALWTAGEVHGIADYGSFAMNVMRMEKGFKGAGELTNEVTWPKPMFFSLHALTKSIWSTKRSTNLKWVCYLEIEPDGKADGHGGEAVMLNGMS